MRIHLDVCLTLEDKRQIPSSTKKNIEKSPNPELNHMVAAATFIFRVTHTLSAGALLAIAAGPFLFASRPQLVDRRLGMILPALSLLSGLYNAGALRPSRMGDAAKPWRMAIYMAKISLMLLCTPLTTKLTGGDVWAADVVRATAIGTAFAVGAWARFYREEHTPAVVCGLFFFFFCVFFFFCLILF
jgi:hypothetical protein